jgi:hypothetical protein
MRVFCLAAVLAVPPVLAQGPPDPTATIDAQRDALKVFARLDGVCRGPAWTILPSGEKHMRSARQEYKKECQEFDRIATEFRECLYQGPDGGEALRLVRHRQSLALNEYKRTVRIYTDLVLKGVLPEEPPNSNKPSR